MKREDMEVGQEYVLSSERYWDKPHSVGRARLIDKDRWVARYMPGDRDQTHEVETQSGTITLRKSIQKSTSKYARDLLIETLDKETGEHLDYRIATSASLKAPWEEGWASVQEAEKKRAEARAKDRAERAEGDARIAAFHEQFGTEQGRYWTRNQHETVVLSIDDAERIMEACR